MPLSAATISVAGGDNPRTDRIVVNFGGGDTSADLHELHRGFEDAFTPTTSTLVQGDITTASASGSVIDSSVDAGTLYFYILVTKQDGEADVQSNVLRVASLDNWTDISTTAETWSNINVTH